METVEHDFYASRYLGSDGKSVPIQVELIIVDLVPEQIRDFKNNLEFWDETTATLLKGPPISATNSPSVKGALRVGFRGWYEAEDDDLKSQTFFVFRD